MGFDPIEIDDDVDTVYLLESGDDGPIWKRIMTIPVDDMAGSALTAENAISPPYLPEKLLELHRSSPHLRAPIDAYITNIDSFGHTYVPLVDLSDERAVERVREALDYELNFHAEADEEIEVDDDLVNTTLENIRVRQRRERLALEHFFDGAYIDGSFVELRRMTRQDIEATGNGYWEIIRDDDGKVASFGYLPSHQMRICNTGTTMVRTTKLVRRSILSVEEKAIGRRLKTYAQIAGNKTIYFKEFGDSRVMSSTSGKIYESIESLFKNERNAVPATETHHFKIHDSCSIYGVPRWIGALVCLLGSKAADEVNLDYFYSKPPAGILMVTGGKLNPDTKSKIESMWNAKVGGQEKFHGLIVIEARSTKFVQEGAGKIGLEFMPLTQSQTNDALFQNYDKQNADKVAMTMRVPRLLRGDVTDVNRASAAAAIQTAEQQVFAPERSLFDEFVNCRILPELGITMWWFQSLGPDPVDLEKADQLVKVIKDAPDVMSPGEARAALGEALNLDLPTREKK